MGAPPEIWQAIAIAVVFLALGVRVGIAFTEWHFGVGDFEQPADRR